MKLVTVVGARPQFIKSDSLSRAIQAFNARADAGGRLEAVVVHTGQHYDDEMWRLCFDELGMARPAHHLRMNGAARVVDTMVAGLWAVMTSERPAIVVVYG